VSSPEGERQAVAEACAAAHRHGIIVDVEQLTEAVRLFSFALATANFAYAASKLVLDIAVMSTEDHNATPVALAALSSLSGMAIDDVSIHHLETAVEDARQLLEKLTPSVLTTSVETYEEIREALREQGHAGIRIVLARGLRPAS
jgi:selenocysteine lyase/cysteine desulfurase